MGLAVALLGYTPKYGSVYTGHCRTLAKVSNGILIGLTDQGKTCATKYYKLIVLLNKLFCEKSL